MSVESFLDNFQRHYEMLMEWNVMSESYSKTLKFLQLSQVCYEM